MDPCVLCLDFDVYGDSNHDSHSWELIFYML